MMPKLNAAQKFSVQQRILRRSHAKLLAAAKAGASAVDTLIGDSDLDDDKSPEFQACQALNKAIDYAEAKVKLKGRSHASQTIKKRSGPHRGRGS